MLTVAAQCLRALNNAQIQHYSSKRETITAHRAQICIIHNIRWTTRITKSLPVKILHIICRQVLHLQPCLT